MPLTKIMIFSLRCTEIPPKPPDREFTIDIEWDVWTDENLPSSTIQVAEMDKNGH